MFHNVADLICTEASPSPSPIEKFFKSDNDDDNVDIAVGSVVEVSASELEMLDDDHQLMTVHGGPSSTFDMLSSPSSLSDASSGYESVTTLLSSASSIDNDCEYQSLSQDERILDSRAQQSRRLQRNSVEQLFPHHHHYIDSLDIQQKQQPNSTVGHLDRNMLYDIRIPKQMLAIEDRYIPWNVAELVYENDRYEVNQSARRILTEWMLDVCEEMKCEEAIFPLAVNYLDRFLMSTPTIRRYQLQLVGVVCLLIASKLRQFTALEPAYLSQMTDYSVTIQEILEWEPLVLKRLGWDVSSVVATDYLDHILVILPQLSQTGQLSCDMNDIGTDCYHHLSCPSSIEPFSSNCCSPTAPICKLSQPPNPRVISSYIAPTPTSPLSFCSSLSLSSPSSSFSTSSSSSPSSISSSSSSMPAILLNRSNINKNSNKRQRTGDNYEYDYDDFNQMFIGNSLSDNQVHQMSNANKKIRSASHKTDEQDQGDQPDMEDDQQSFQETIRRHANTFITLCATEMQFVCVKPSVIATACVATSIRGIFNQRKLKRQQNSHYHHHQHHYHHYHSATQSVGSVNNGCVVSEVDQYQHFLQTIEQQIGIDKAYIDHNVDRIEALFAVRTSKLSSSISSSTTSASSSSVVSSKPLLTSASSESKLCSTPTSSLPSPNAISLSAPVNCPVKSQHQHNSNLHPRSQSYHSLSQQHSMLHSNTTSSHISSSSSSSTSNSLNSASNYHHHHQFVHTTFAQVPNAKQLLMLATVASSVAAASSQSASSSSAGTVRNRRTSLHHPSHYNHNHHHHYHYIPSSIARPPSTSFSSLSPASSSTLHDASNSHHTSQQASSNTTYTSSATFKCKSQNCTSTLAPNNTTLATDPSDHLASNITTIDSSIPGNGFHILPDLMVSSTTYQNDENRENIPIRILNHTEPQQSIVTIDSNRSEDNRIYDSSTAPFYSIILDDDSLNDNDGLEEDYSFY